MYSAPGLYYNHIKLINITINYVLDLAHAQDLRCRTIVIIFFFRFQGRPRRFHPYSRDLGSGM